MERQDRREKRDKVRGEERRKREKKGKQKERWSFGLVREERRGNMSEPQLERRKRKRGKNEY